MTGACADAFAGECIFITMLALLLLQSVLHVDVHFIVQSL